MGGALTAFASELAAAHRTGADIDRCAGSELLARAAAAGDLAAVRAFLASYLARTAVAPGGEHPQAVPQPARQLASFQLAAPPPEPLAPPSSPEPHGTEDVDRAAILAAVERGGLPFAVAPAQSPPPLGLPRPNETVFLGDRVAGEVSGGTVVLSTGAPPSLEVPFTIAPTHDAARPQALPFLPLDTFAEIATAMMRGENPLPLFAAHGVHPVQYLQCSGAFYERAASDPTFKRALDDAMSRAERRRR